MTKLVMYTATMIDQDEKWRDSLASPDLFMQIKMDTNLQTERVRPLMIFLEFYQTLDATLKIYQYQTPTSKSGPQSFVLESPKSLLLEKSYQFQRGHILRLASRKIS